MCFCDVELHITLNHILKRESGGAKPLVFADETQTTDADSSLGLFWALLMPHHLYNMYMVKYISMCVALEICAGILVTLSSSCIRPEGLDDLLRTDGATSKRIRAILTSMC